MPTTLEFAEHGTGIGDAASVLRNNALAAGLDAPVPTCPGWSVLDLLVHVGMVQRWATDVVRGLAREQWRHPVDVQREGRAAASVLDWVDEGLVDLLNALAGAPADLDAFFFLKDAPRPREAWARRQCHELTVHAVDAMAARLGGPPTARQTWVRPGLAVDGIDELLRGFVPRRSGPLRSARPLTVLVRATDTDAAWTLHVSREPVVTEVGAPASGTPDAVLEASATALYLGLWNRGDEITGAGSAEFLATWRQLQRVAWS